MKLHRSLIFWAGLVVMSFLVWAWRDSERERTAVRGGRCFATSLEGGFALGLGSRAYKPICGEVFGDRPGWSASFQWIRNPGGQGWVERERVARWRRNITNEDDPAFEVLAEQISSSKGGWAIYVPYWMVLLGILLSWIGALLWRGRRMKQLGILMEGGEG